MEEYMRSTFEKSEVFSFKQGSGGIADCIKFFMYQLHRCIRTKTRLYYLVNNIPLEKYLKLKYTTQYITQQTIDSNPSLYTVFYPENFYASFSFDGLDIPFQDVFTFSEEVNHRASTLFETDTSRYATIHVRLGDKFLETDKSFVYCTWDERPFDEKRLYKYIEEYPRTLLVLSDNKGYKLKLKEKYDKICITNCTIGHTSFTNTTEEQTLDAVAEFYLATNSDEIIAASRSGFSKVASLFKHVPYHILY